MVAFPNKPALPPTDICISIGGDLVPYGTGQLVVRLNDYDREVVNRAADTMRLSQAEFVRCALVEAARAIMITHWGSAEINFDKDYRR